MKNFVIIKDNLLNDLDCKFLLDLYNLNYDKLGEHIVNNGKTSILQLYKNIDKKIDNLINKKVDLVKKTIDPNLNIINIQIVKWQTNLEMLPHFDSLLLNHKVASVCYLNDDYTGGETFCENSFFISPKKGRCIIFDGVNIKHGVKKINGKDRYTFISWFA